MLQLNRDAIWGLSTRIKDWSEAQKESTDPVSFGPTAKSAGSTRLAS